MLDLPSTTSLHTPEKTQSGLWEPLIDVPHPFFSSDNYFWPFSLSLAPSLNLIERPCLMATSITLKNGEQVKINGICSSFYLQTPVESDLIYFAIFSNFFLSMIHKIKTTSTVLPAGQSVTARHILSRASWSFSLLRVRSPRTRAKARSLRQCTRACASHGITALRT